MIRILQIIQNCRLQIKQSSECTNYRCTENGDVRITDPAASIVVDVRITEKQITERDITEVRITEEWITEERITEERITEEWITEEWITEERITEVRMAEVRITEERIAEFGDVLITDPAAGIGLMYGLQKNG